MGTQTGTQTDGQYENITFRYARVVIMSWPENQGILFFIYFSNISNISKVNAVLLIHWFCMGDRVRH